MANTVKCPSFDDFVNGRTRYNPQTHIKGAVEFAHPMDAGIIKVLDNKLINEMFEKYVDASVDLQNGLALSTSLKVDEKSNPDLYNTIVECSEKLNIPVPYTVVSSSVSGINAQTAGTDEFAYVAVSSLLTVLLSAQEQKFVIGHECGHIALGHIVYHTALGTLGMLGNLIPIVGDFIANTIQFPLNAWSRRSEISADRAGLICCGDITTAKKALLKLEAGFMDIDNVDIDDYLKNSKTFRKSNSLGKLTEIFQTHPIIPKRIEALELFANSEKYYRIANIPIPGGVRLIGDLELEKRTEQIIKVIS